MSKTKERERFEKFIYYSIDGCWYWTGSLDGGNYGRIWFNGRNRVASAVSYELNKGVIGDLLVCHSCDNPSAL